MHLLQFDVFVGGESQLSRRTPWLVPFFPQQLPPIWIISWVDNFRIHFYAGPNGILIHKCTCCTAYFESRKDMLKHRFNTHKNTVCNICRPRLTFKSTSVLASHMRLRHRKRCKWTNQQNETLDHISNCFSQPLYSSVAYVSTPSNRKQNWEHMVGNSMRHPPAKNVEKYFWSLSTSAATLHSKCVVGERPSWMSKYTIECATLEQTVITVRWFHLALILRNPILMVSRRWRLLT